MHALNCECAGVCARGCYVITKGVQQAPPDQLRHRLRPRAPVRARNEPDPPRRVPTCPGTLRTSGGDEIDGLEITGPRGTILD